MAVVPFPVSSPGVPPAVAAGTRGAAAPRTHASAPRGAQAAAPGDARPPTPAGKAKPAFAQVLADARGDAEGTLEKPSSSAAPVTRRGASPDDDPAITARESDQSSDDAGVTVVAPAPDDARVMQASSWLLLALGQGPMARGEHAAAVVSPDEASGAAVEAASTADPTATLVPLAVPVSMAVAPNPTSTPGQDGAFAVGPAGGSAVGVDVATEGGLIAATAPAAGGAADAQAASTAGQQLPPPADVDAVEGAVQVTSPGSAGSDTPEQTSPLVDATVPRDDTSRPTPEALARWRAASRAIGGAGGPRLAMPAGVATGSSNDVMGATTRADAPVPGAVARELAQLVGRGAGAADPVGAAAAAAAGALPATELGSEAVVNPTTRAAEVLLRLAQAGAEVPVAARPDDLGNAAAFAQLLAPSSAAPQTASVATPAPAATLPPAVGEQVNTHIVSSLKMQWKDGIGEAKLHLRPDAYGAVTVALRVEHGAVTAVVRSDSPQVQEWVMQHQQTLRQQMEAAGLRLDELTVTPDDRGQQEGEPDAQPEQRRRARRGKPDDPDGPAFELLA